LAHIAVTKDGDFLLQCASEFQDNEGIALLAIRTRASAFRFASSRLQRDRDFVIKAAKINGNVMKWATEFAQDEEIVGYAQAQITAASKSATDHNTINIVVQP